MVVAFIGNDSFDWTARITRRFNRKISKLVEKDGARAFLFTGEGLFNFVCWAIVSRLSKKYDGIERVRVQTKCEEDDDPLKDPTIMYERALLSSDVGGAGESAVARNEAMVKMCDVLVVYVNPKDLRNPEIESAAKSAVQFAREMKKKIINVY